MFAVILAIGMPALIASESPSAERASAALAVEAVDYTARTIYHSPEKPGWTSWVGLWLTPGGARMGDPFPNGYSDRMQSIVVKQGEGWRPGPATLAPFPHSGFPEVLLTAEGVILHLATDGIYWTANVGRTWTRLPIPGTAYYPRAVQLASGNIVCIGHVGGDDVYGTVDQSIFQQRFRLKVTRARGQE